MGVAVAPQYRWHAAKLHARRLTTGTPHPSDDRWATEVNRRVANQTGGNEVSGTIEFHPGDMIMNRVTVEGIVFRETSRENGGARGVVVTYVEPVGVAVV